MSARRPLPAFGGAALGTLVLLANEQGLSRRVLHATIDAERARNERLVAENERLQKELSQVNLKLKPERQNKFATTMSFATGTPPQPAKNGPKLNDSLAIIRRQATTVPNSIENVPF
jgi:hypothetical protein